MQEILLIMDSSTGFRTKLRLGSDKATNFRWNSDRCGFLVSGM